MMAGASTDGRSLLRVAAIIVGGITALRVLIQLMTPLQLYPDEAQYWWWAQTPDWGYFSKPPLIAWIIWLTTRLSNAEWAIRLASPLLHAATALVLFGIGRLTHSARVGLWSAVAYVTLPGISYSSGLISTDVPLLFCWAVALYAFLRARERPNWRWTALCGAALGMGFLAKYAMVYFLLGAGLSAVVDARSRQLLLSAYGAAALLLGLLLLSPNLLWNAAHGFPTLVHTEANANWGHAKYDAASAAGFLLGQFGVFGPLMMAGWIVALIGATSRGQDRDADILLAAFSLPILLLIVAQSFISDANANWAAPAYLAATPLAVSALLRIWRGRLLHLSVALGATAMVGLWVGQISPAVADRVGLGNALKRQEGWRAIGAAVAAETARTRYDAIAASNRSLLAELLYYAQPRSVPVRAWNIDPVPHDHFDMTMPLQAAARRVLLVGSRNEAATMSKSFRSERFVRSLEIPLGRGRKRVLALYDAEFFHGPQLQH